jgi:hypothetical protein
MTPVKFGVIVAAAYAVPPVTWTEAGVMVAAIPVAYVLALRFMKHWKQRQIDREFEHVANLQKAAMAGWQAEARVIQGRKIR